MAFKIRLILLYSTDYDKHYFIRRRVTERKSNDCFIARSNSCRNSIPFRFRFAIFWATSAPPSNRYKRLQETGDCCCRRRQIGDVRPSVMTVRRRRRRREIVISDGVRDLDLELTAITVDAVSHIAHGCGRFCPLAVLDSIVDHTVDLLSPFISLSSVILIDFSTVSPVHVLMLSNQAVHGLPRLHAPGIVPGIISFSRQLPCFLMV